MSEEKAISCHQKVPQEREFRRDLTPDVKTPDWAKNVVWYQIMLDRWRNGNPDNDPDNAPVPPWTWDWFKPFTAEEKRDFYAAVLDRIYGGDLQGMMESLDYLEELGVTGIYLNPVFEAPSHHKYDTADYRHIDDHFGFRGDIEKACKTETPDPSTWVWTKTDKLFLAFLEEAHRRGFKVIIDGVFNHSGTNFWAFQDLVKNTKQSRFKHWYFVKKWDVKPKSPGEPTFAYDGWAGFAGLPKYAEDNNGLLPGIRNHIFEITRRWQDPNGDGDPSDGVDGWRLDVPECVNPNFWVDWRKVVKGVNPDAYTSGEIWEKATDWLQGDHFDAVMNYEFTKRIYGFFLPGGKTPAISASEFGRSLEEMLRWYPPQVNFVLQNLLGSHDTDRIVSAIHNRAGWRQGRIQDNNPSYDPSEPAEASYDILKQIVTFQMMWVGAPMVYYGDEVGMYGADDPTNRMPMWWEDLMPYDNPTYRIHNDLLDHYKRMIAIRNSFPALRTGRARILLADDDRELFIFERRDAQNRVIVALNSRNLSQTVRLSLPEGPDARFVNIADLENTRVEKGIVQGIGSKRNVVKVRRSAKTIRIDEGSLTFVLPPKGAVILLQVSPLSG